MRSQETQWRGFADVGFSTAETRGKNSSFRLGQLDLFVVSQLSERVSFLGETVIEFDRTFVADVERLILSYALAPSVRLSAGRHHTPIGYWSTAYHHGELIQPTIDRPLLFRFEDEGGILPIHTTGISISGRDLTPFHLGYDVMIGNGIGSTPVADNNDAKSYTLAMNSQVTSAVEVGGSLYFDRISAGTPNLLGQPLAQDVRQRLLGAFAVYQGSSLGLLGEYQHSVNTLPSGSAPAADAFYLYGGYRVGKLVPYARYDEIRYSGIDPYFAAQNDALAVLGARLDLAATAVVKLELHRRRMAGTAPTSAFAAQFAIGF